MAPRIWKKRWLPLLALWGLVFVAFSNSFQAALVFDSASVIGDDPRIREATPENIAAVLTGRYWYVSTGAKLYRPMTNFSYLINYAVLGNGTRPTGYHVVNLALHEINVGLTYALGVEVFGATAPALALAAIWGLHPVVTESVTNVVGRADLLAALGVIAGFLCHINANRAADRRRAAWIAGLSAAQTIAIFSKESGAVLPGIMLFYDLMLSERAEWRRRIPSYAAVALPLAAFFYLRGGLLPHMRIDPAENPLATTGFWTARLTAMQVIGRYLWLYLWPARLSADYSYKAVPLFGQGSFPEEAFGFIALLVFVGGTLLALRSAIRRHAPWKPLFFSVAFFFAALSPTSNLIILIGSIMAERFLYLPSIGLAGCVVVALQAFGRRQRFGLSYTSLAVGLVCLAYTARTYARNFDWQDDLQLWTSAVNVCPDGARPHYNLGNALMRIPGRLPDAIAEYQAALWIRPDDADAHNNLGNALSGIPGRLPDAIAEYQTALRIRPDDADWHDNLGNALSGIPGRLPDAIAEYRTALRIRPLQEEFHYNLASALARIPGRLPDAIAEYQAALQIRPDNADAHNNLGNALVSLPGRLPDAIAQYQAALRIQPGNADAHYNLGNVLAGLPGRLPDAIAEYQAALRIRPGDAKIHNNLGTALSEAPGRLPEAIREYQEALRIQPDFAEAHINLGGALQEMPGRLPEAIAEYEAALRVRTDPHVRQILDQLRRSQAAASR